MGNYVQNSPHLSERVLKEVRAVFIIYFLLKIFRSDAIAFLMY